MQHERLKKLINYCRPSQKGLKRILADELVYQRGAERVLNRNGFLYSTGKHPVLLIAHLDTVHGKPPTQFYIDRTQSSEGDLWCKEGIGGDDRCGVFLIMELIQALDCHVLFTEDEETGGRGAVLFSQSNIKPDVQYIVEFDRRGNSDAVFYDCDNPEFTAFVESYGFRQTRGTFSDISYIAPALGYGAVNLSSGYYHAHTRQEYIRIADMDSILERASRLITNVDTQFKYAKREYRQWTWAWDTRLIEERCAEGYGKMQCPCCHAVFEEDDFFDYCPYCDMILIVECELCGADVWLGDCAVVNEAPHCRYCIEENLYKSRRFCFG